MDRPVGPRLVTVAPSAFAAEAARLIRGALLLSLESGEASMALSGGQTPRAVYALLGRESVGELPYERCSFFFGDERWVDARDPDSNAGEAIRSWFLPRRVPPSRIHPFFGKSPTEARRSVEDALRELADRQGATHPRLDLVLLGLGDDGHTASLFPHSEALDERVAWTAETTSPKPPPVRLTMTLPVLNASRRVVFLVTGAEKKDVLERFVQGDPSLVASRVQGPEVTVLADLQAASGLRME